MKFIDYESFSKKYKPDIVKILLIGEAPPPNGKSYFYKIPEKYPIRNYSIEDDATLPATIFNHYFGRRPNDPNEYESFLNCLKDKGVFFIDLFKEPEKFRGNKKNQEKIFTDDNIKHLEKEICSLGSDDSIKIIFLLARQYTKNHLNKLKSKFQHAAFIRWKDFRINVNENIEYK